MSTMQICGIAICCTVFSLVVKESRKEMSLLIAISGSVLILGCALATITPAISYVSTLLEESAFSPYTAILFKALGLGYIVQTASDVCRDSGESAIASKLEMLGKAEITILSLPLIKQLIDIASSLV